MVSVAERFRRQIVDLDDTGSSPVRHPTNARYEPPFLRHRTVLFYGSDDMVAHVASRRCRKECPHAIATCGEFEWP